MNFRKYHRGVTLIELMVAITVLAIAVSLAAPSFSDTVRNQRLSSRSFALQEDLAYARAEAVKLQGNVALAAKSGDLNNGWVVFADADADEVLDVAERTLREEGAMSAGYTMKAATGTGNPKAGVGFDRRGALVGRGTLAVLICAPGYQSAKDKDYARNMRVASNGRAESAKGKGKHAGLSCS
jgi:prepilin-type N-terminal cleavage/methylation domain-containing protein